MSPSPQADSPVSVLCVCTGNICRSPAAERLLAVRLGPAVRISSAGTGALVGQPISPPMDTLVAQAGGDPAGFRARQLTEDLLAPAELVLAMSTAHRTAVVELWPRAVRRTFTLKELARLLADVDATSLPPAEGAARLRAAVSWASANRSPAGSPGADDVPDPYRRGSEAYLAAFRQVRAAVWAIGEVVAPSGG